MKKLIMVLPLTLILCFMVGCQDKEAMAELEEIRAQAALEEQNKALIKQYFAELDSGVVENIDNFADKFLSPECIWHFPGGANVSGIEAIKEYIVGTNTSLPGLTHTIDDVIAEGDKIAIRMIARGTHQKEFMGMKPTGNEFTVTGASVLLILEGKIVEWWIESDYYSFAQQLGMELKPKEGE
ncbi:ester cyclase [Acidobacteriota bacterium]